MRLLLLVALLTFIAPDSAQAQKRVCADSNKGILVVKRRCKAPRFSEISSTALSAPTLVIVNVTDDLELNLQESTNIAANCPEGYKTTGGGVSIIDNDGLAIRRTIPDTTLSSWRGGVTSEKNGASGTLSVYAICAEGATLKDDEEEEEES